MDDTHHLCAECNQPSSDTEALVRLYEKGKNTLIFYYQQLGRDPSKITEDFETGRLYTHSSCRSKLRNDVEKLIRRKHKAGKKNIQIV